VNDGSARCSAISGRPLRSRRVRRLGPALVIAALLAACGVDGAVEVERAAVSRGELQPDVDTIDGSASRPGSEPGPGDDEPATTLPTAPSTIAWGTCDGFGIPDADQLGTSGWECGRLDVPMNPDDPDGGLPPVSLAVTRHLATGDRFGTIAVNPGGPGAPGLPLAWNLRSALPAELLRGFDIVSWDPRGLGQSTPRLGCPSDALPDDADFIERCVETSGPLASFIAAPYTVADMEQLRVALGEERLDFLGYSYGSILGAEYAARHPDRVGSFVLDGVTDPDVGSIDGPVFDGFPTFADDGLPAALDRFHELCDASELCLPAASDSEAAVAGVAGDAADLPTDDFDGEPEELSAVLVDEHMGVSMQFAGEWELLAAALGEAAAGDGSLLAAHVDYNDFSPDDGDGGDGEPGDDDGSAPDNFEAANFLIYCADLGPYVEWSFCDDMPVAADPLRRVRAVELDRPILLIGTEYDPLTPGYHAEEAAERLGDAVWMLWEGVGHTAFPGWTRCIDDAVTDQFLGRALSESGTRCSFVEGVETDAELAEGLFGFDVADGRSWLASELEFSGRTDVATAECIAREIIPDDTPDNTLVSELILDVRSDEAEAAFTAAAASC